MNDENLSEHMFFYSERITMKALNRFWKAHLAELHNMTWPSQKRAKHATFVVLFIMLLTGVFLGLVDYGLKQLMFLFLGN